MKLDALSSLVSRVFFALAFVCLALGVLEKLVNLGGFTLVGESLSPSRLLEWAVTLLIFVIALLLRQIREGRAKA